MAHIKTMQEIQEGKYKTQSAAEHIEELMHELQNN